MPGLLDQIYTPMTVDDRVRMNSTPQGLLFGSMKPYNPTWQDKVSNSLSNIFGGGYHNRRRARDIVGASEFLPVTGDAAGVADTATAFRKGNPIEGTLLGAATGVGLIPLAGNVMSKPLRAGIKSAASAARNLGSKGGGLLDALPPGAAPDRTNYSLVRFRPPRGSSARFSALMDRYNNNPELADEMRRIVQRGEKIGREWYNTEDLRKMFIDELGEKAGDDAWREYLRLIGATSTGSKVEPNVRNASYYFKENAPLPGSNSGAGALTMQTQNLKSGNLIPKKGSGYGHKMQINQAKNVGNYYDDAWGATADPRLNPKPRGFAQSLMGSSNNIAADKHFMRMMAMMSDDPQFLHTSGEVSKEVIDKLRKQFGKKVEPFISTREVNGKPAYNFNAKAAVLGKRGNKKIKAAKPVDGMFDFIKGEKIKGAWADMPNDNEYADFEKFVNNLAEEMNMTGPQLQASFWMGAAQDTGVDASSQDTFMNIFHNILEQRAAERGIPKEKVLKNFIRRIQPLALPVAAVTGAGLLGAGGDDNNEAVW